MAAVPPAPPPPPPPRAVLREPDEPSNRWPWVALALGLLVIGVAAAFFFINRQRTVNVSVTGSPTLSAVAAATSGPPPTVVLPTRTPSATLAPSATAVPSATPAPSPTSAPATPTPLAIATQAADTAAGSQPTQPAGQPGDAAQPAGGVAPTAAPAQPTPAAQPTATVPLPPAATPAAPTAPATPTAPPAATLVPSPTVFTGQVASSGGFGNTRADLDAAYGAPTGETPEHLVVYRKGNLEYHAGFVPSSGRNDVLVVVSQPAAGQTATPYSLDQAVADAHKLLPTDAQPPNPQQEGNPQFVVERFTSPSLAQALPADMFTANKGQPGQFLVVYVRDPAQPTRTSRFIIGPGNDPNALMSQGR